MTVCFVLKMEVPEAFAPSMYQGHGAPSYNIRRNYRKRPNPSNNNNGEFAAEDYFRPSFLQDPWEELLGGKRDPNDPVLYVKPSFFEDPWATWQIK